MRRAASAGVIMSAASRRQNLRAIPREIRDGDEPGRVAEAKHGEGTAQLTIVGHHSDPVAGIMHGRIENRLRAGHLPVHFDLRQRLTLEPLDQHDVRVAEVAAGEGDRIGFLLGVLEQHALAGRFHQHALGSSLVPVAPGVLSLLVHVGGMAAVFDRHDAELAARELGGERDEKRRLAGILEPDDGDHPRRCHSRSARSRSSGVFTLKNSSLGSPKPLTVSRESIPTLTSAWKEIAFRSPLSRRRSMAARQAGPYTAHSGSRPRRLSLSGRKASNRLAVAPSTSAASSGSGTNGMSHATHSTGSVPAATAV